MGEFAKKSAKEKIEWRNLGISYFYLKESFHIPEHIAGQEVKLTAIVLKDSPTGPARLIVLTNLPPEEIDNHLLIKELSNWINAEKRFNDFQDRSKTQRLKVENLLHLKAIDALAGSSSVEELFDSLSDIVFNFFESIFIPPHCREWNHLKIKDVFLRQKGSILRTSKFIFHKLLITNKLCNREDLEYICNRFNEIKISDSSGRILWFGIGEESV